MHSHEVKRKSEQANERAGGRAISSEGVREKPLKFKQTNIENRKLKNHTMLKIAILISKAKQRKVRQQQLEFVFNTQKSSK